MTDTDDIRRYLLTLAGTLMEDASAAAILDDQRQPIIIRIAALETCTVDLAALARVMRLIETNVTA